MEERQVTIDGVSHPMPTPFLVIATQNPIEYEGTFALPEAQLDRFMLRLPRLPEGDGGDRHPRRAEARHPIDELQQVLDIDELREMQAAVKEIYVDQAVAEYIVAAGDGDPRARGRLPGRVAARLASTCTARARRWPRSTGATT